MNREHLETLLLTAGLVFIVIADLVAAGAAPTEPAHSSTHPAFGPAAYWPLTANAEHGGQSGGIAAPHIGSSGLDRDSGRGPHLSAP